MGANEVVILLFSLSSLVSSFSLSLRPSWRLWDAGISAGRGLALCWGSELRQRRMQLIPDLLALGSCSLLEMFVLGGYRVMGHL